jgi:thiamine monophosphate kinase
VNGVAIGIVDGNAPLMRTSCRPGDLLYTTGSLGRGNAYALSRLLTGDASLEYLPHARLHEGSCLTSIASAAMDTRTGSWRR